MMTTDTLIKAAIKTDNVFSDGYIHISNKLVEGLFTMDYAKIELKNNKLILNLCVHTNKVDVNKKTGELSNFRSVTEYRTYQCKHLESTLYVPDTYLLSDSDGNFLFLSLLEVERDPLKIKHLLEFIENHREII